MLTTRGCARRVVGRELRDTVTDPERGELRRGHVRLHQGHGRLHRRLVGVGEQTGCGGDVEDAALHRRHDLDLRAPEAELGVARRDRGREQLREPDLVERDRQPARRSASHGRAPAASSARASVATAPRQDRPPGSGETFDPLRRRAGLGGGDLRCDANRRRADDGRQRAPAATSTRRRRRRSRLDLREPRHRRHRRPPSPPTAAPSARALSPTRAPPHHRPPTKAAPDAARPLVEPVARAAEPVHARRSDGRRDTGTGTKRYAARTDSALRTNDDNGPFRQLPRPRRHESLRLSRRHSAHGDARNRDPFRNPRPRIGDDNGDERRNEQDSRDPYRKPAARGWLRPRVGRLSDARSRDFVSARCGNRGKCAGVCGGGRLTAAGVEAERWIRGRGCVRGSTDPKGLQAVKEFFGGVGPVDVEVRRVIAERHPPSRVLLGARPRGCVAATLCSTEARSDHQATGDDDLCTGEDTDRPLSAERPIEHD